MAHSRTIAPHEVSRARRKRKPQIDSPRRRLGREPNDVEPPSEKGRDRAPNLEERARRRATQPVWQSTTAEEKNCEMWFVQAILQLEQEAQDALQAGHLAVKALRKLPDPPDPDLTSAEKLDRAERCVPGFKCGPGYYSDVKVWRRERDSQKAHADATEA